MARPGEGDAKTGALFVVGFFVVLFLLWIGIGGPSQSGEPSPLLYEYPNAPQVINTNNNTDAPSTQKNEVLTSIYSATTTIPATKEPQNKMFFAIASVAVIIFIVSARYGSTGGGDKGGGGKK